MTKLLGSHRVLLHELKHSIRSYSTYEKNWDGYGGIAPTDETIKDALNFVKLLPKNIVLPYTGLSGDGEISLIWHAGKMVPLPFVHIGFTGNGKYSYYCQDRNGREYYEDDLVISSMLPKNLINIIKAL